MMLAQASVRRLLSMMLLWMGSQVTVILRVMSNVLDQRTVKWKLRCWLLGMARVIEWMMPTQQQLLQHLVRRVWEWELQWGLQLIQ
jgi:hypothetical protein